VNLRNLVVVLLELVNKLGGVKLAVAPTSLHNLCLLLQRKVPSREAGTNILLEEAQSLIMKNSARVGETVDTSLVMLCQKNRGGEEVSENGVGIGNVNYTSVL